MRLSKGLLQAYAIQDLTFNALTKWRDDRLNEAGKICLGENDGSVLLQLVKSWSEAQDRVRIHRNKPLPGVLKHESKPTKRKGGSAHVVVLDPMSDASSEMLPDEQAGNPADQSADQATGQAS